MKKGDYGNIRYVDLLAYWKLLYQIHITPGESIGDILKATSLDYALGGQLPLEKAIRLGLNLKCIAINSESKAELSSEGEDLISINQSNEPNSEVMRIVIRKILDEHRFPWVVFCDNDETIFRASIPNNWEIILDNSGLLQMEDSEVLKWWQSLFFKYNQDKEAKAKGIGDVGERLTHMLEVARLTKDGIDPSIRVSWAASVDDQMGFDILSLHGKFHNGPQDKQILIEVKSSQFTTLEGFRFYISRNEWNKALENLDDYFFYFWTGVKLDGSFDDGPFTLVAREVLPLVPKDQSEHGEWRECRMTLNLNGMNKLEAEEFLNEIQ
ncbi:MAG: DUF3883 domain-containing protein [Bacteroidota bacterium]